MEYKFEKCAQVREPKNKSGMKYIGVGFMKYTNDLDYCILQDFLNDEIEQRAEEEKKAKKYVAIFGGTLMTNDAETLLESIYKIQRTPHGSEDFAKVVAKELPFVVKYGRDITSSDFQRELRQTGEFLEQMLKSGVHHLDSEPIITKFIDK